MTKSGSVNTKNIDQIVMLGCITKMWTHAKITVGKHKQCRSYSNLKVINKKIWTIFQSNCR